MTVRDNLMFGLRAHRLSKGEAEDRIREMLGRVGLATRMEAKPHQLSGGEQQRVALARALVLRPSILLDEPLSSLDEERKQLIGTDLLALHGQFGFTLIYVMHDPAEADMLGSRVCRMREGQLALHA